MLLEILLTLITCVLISRLICIKKNTQITLASTFSLLLRLYPVLTKVRLTMPQVTVYKWMWYIWVMASPHRYFHFHQMAASFPTGHKCAHRACGYRCPLLLLAVNEDVISSGLLIVWYGINNWIGIGSPGHVWPETFLCECVKQILVCLSSRMGW